MKNKIINNLKRNKKKILYSSTLIILLIPIGILALNKYNDTIKNNLNNKNWIKNNTSIIKTNINEYTYSTMKDKHITTYNTLFQEEIDNKINDLLKTNNYTIDNPLMIYNPYSTNTNSINLYFNTDTEEELSYKIEVDGFSSFERTLKNTGEDNYTKTHSYQLIGFIMGYNNKLTLTLKNKDNEEQSYTYNLNFENYKIDTDTKLKIEEDNNEELSDGLFAILGDSREDQDYIHLVDNDGIVRSEIPIIGYRAVNLLFNNNKMYFSVSERKLARMNILGKIEKIYKLGNHKLHHDYAFDDEKENLLILSSDTEDDSCEDEIIKLNLETGKITDSFKLEEVFKDLRENAYYNKDEVAKEVESVGVDWMHINTINYFKDDTVILSSRETSSIIKIKNIFESPEIVYILGDESFYKDFDEKKYLYSKIGDFTNSGGQHTVTYIETNEEGVYYLSMFNNNIGISTTEPNFNWKSIGLNYSSPKDNGKSYYYKYKVDENNKTYELVESFEVPFSAYMGSTQEYSNNIIVDSAQQCTFQETNQDGSIKKKFRFNCKSSIYRVFKYNFNNFYFI